MHARRQDLFDHPGVGPDRGGIQAHERQGDDDGRGPVAALGGAAVNEPLHELAQPLRLEWTVLHFVLDKIVGRLGELPAFFVAAARDADVVDRLAGVEQLDHLVETFRLAVMRIAALSRHQRREGESCDRKCQEPCLHRTLAFIKSQRSAPTWKSAVALSLEI